VRNKNEFMYWNTSMIIENTTNPLKKLFQKLIRKTYQKRA